MEEEVEHNIQNAMEILNEDQPEIAAVRDLGIAQRTQDQDDFLSNKIVDTLMEGEVEHTIQNAMEILNEVQPELASESDLDQKTQYPDDFLSNKIVDIPIDYDRHGDDIHPEGPPGQSHKAKAVRKQRRARADCIVTFRQYLPRAAKTRAKEKIREAIKNYYVVVIKGLKRNSIVKRKVRRYTTKSSQLKKKTKAKVIKKNQRKEKISVLCESSSSSSHADTNDSDSRSLSSQ